MENTNQVIKTQSILEFCRENGLKDMSRTVLETKDNKYPYIMFTTGDPKDQSVVVCFSIGASQEVAAGQVVTKELLNNYRIGFTTNAAGEERIKLVRANNISVEDLLAA